MAWGESACLFGLRSVIVLYIQRAAKVFKTPRLNFQMGYLWPQPMKDETLTMQCEVSV